MPTPADTLVAAYRNWLDTEAGGGPFGSLADTSSQAARAAAAAAGATGSASLPPTGTQDSRRQLLDRYHQHTIHCASCRWGMCSLRMGSGCVFVAGEVGDCVPGDRHGLRCWSCVGQGSLLSVRRGAPWHANLRFGHCSLVVA